ncbi:hypothetical protein RRG08_006400 [Elysia crispata]|uniref:B30.2/SPRY domain-containing protein n=1 Tax=Elysia crispata TaxID=231223 RepID=A0AAE0Y2C6_9GAST|nr:hypothetical protein RRG08_006400 [Elysia crispata]
MEFVQSINKKEKQELSLSKHSSAPKPSNMGSTASTSHKGMREAVPMWIYTAKLPEDQTNHKFTSMSSGMQQLGPNTVARQRTGKFDTDAARWKEGFSSGKHVFEVVFPVAQRGVHASVGVGHDNVPLTLNKSCSLVGNCKESWALDLSTRRAVHAAGIKKYPSTQVFLPDKFYMYLDADSGSLMFGSDHTYYGTAFDGIPTDKPLYPMVSAVTHGATITLFYRGEGVVRIGPLRKKR